MNHRFLVRILVNRFKSHDFSSAADVLRKDRDPDRRSDILDRIDTEAVTKRLIDLLEIRNKEEQSIGITGTHVEEIKEYLKALVHSLAKDKLFAALSEKEKSMVSERILEEVRGRMMEDIVLLETSKSVKRHKRVFKLQFAVGEFDMAIYDPESNTCECYEIKHSNQIVPAQMRYLLDEEKLNQTSKRFGDITKRCVLYRGEDTVLENGIEYRNVERYLRSQ